MRSEKKSSPEKQNVAFVVPFLIEGQSVPDSAQPDCSSI